MAWPPFLHQNFLRPLWSLHDILRSQTTLEVEMEGIATKEDTYWDLRMISPLTLNGLIETPSSVYESLTFVSLYQGYLSVGCLCPRGLTIWTGTDAVV